MGINTSKLNSMLKKHNYFLLALFVSIPLLSCNKDQSAVRKLDGNWKATKMIAFDSSVGYGIDLILLGGEMNFTFDGCKLKDNEWCTGSSTLTFNGTTESESILYRVSGKGSVLEAQLSENDSLETSITIIDLSRKNCVLKWVDGTTTIDLEMFRTD